MRLGQRQSRPLRPRRARSVSVGACVRCALALLAWLSCWLLWPSLAVAQPAAVVLEIDAAAEAILDVRVARRLVSLELAEIDVPPDVEGRRPALFYRVLGRPERQVRVELWELGSLYDVRAVSGAQGGGHLLARRVALAAAELARRLRQRRLISRRDRERELARLRALAALATARTREGPLALRAEFGGLRSAQLTLLGPGLGLEIGVRRALRVDLTASLLGGPDDSGRALMTLATLGVGPAFRFRTTSWLDLDLAALASASTAHVAGATRVDAIDGERDTWTARAALALRVQPRLSRWVRASVGAEGGLFLRAMPAQFPDGAGSRFRGFYLGAALGVVLTPR